ncbi:MAG: hypothetical protein PSX37_08485, partial [bacterium]|nr:hypothetical protein [bacterium]
MTKVDTQKERSVLMKNIAIILCVASCAATALAQPLNFVTNEPGAGFIDISGNLLDSLVLTDNGVMTITLGSGQGNALFPPGGSWTIGNNGGMGFNIPVPDQALPPGPGAFPIPSGSSQIGPAFGGIQKALIPGWDDEGDSVIASHDVFAKVDTVNNMLIVQWNELPVGFVGDTTTFQVQVPFGSALQCGVYARFIYVNVNNPTVQRGGLFSIGYQDGELGQNNSVNIGFLTPNVIQDGMVLSLTCQDPCFWQTNGCPADYDNDLDTDSDDIIAFFSDWDRGDNCADVNRDNAVDSNDVVFFF